MEDKLIKILQSLRNINPEPDFKKRSRALILTLPEVSKAKKFVFEVFESLKFGAAIGFAVLLLFFLAGGLSYFKITNIAPAVLSNFEEKSLTAEAANVDFKIQLGEVKYFDESAEQIAAVLKDISQIENEKDIDKILDEIIL